MVKLKNSNCDETQKIKLGWNSNSDETQKLILWGNSKSQMEIKKKKKIKK